MYIFYICDYDTHLSYIASFHLFSLCSMKLKRQLNLVHAVMTILLLYYKFLIMIV